MKDALPFSVIVPTRNSSKWILQFLAAYRRLGIQPLYIVDPRSSDDTQELLLREGARYVLFEPRGNFIEAGTLAFAADHVDHPWILRIDDDEFPSSELIRWAKAEGCGGKTNAWGLPRHNLYRQNDVFMYSTSSSVHDYAENRRIINPQFRLYRHKSVVYIEEIHTPGFYVSDMKYAPPQANLLHFDVLLKSFDQRIEKIRSYEREKPGFGWAYGDQYLPELVPAKELDPQRQDMAELADLVSALPLVDEPRDVTLACEDIRSLRGENRQRERHERRVALQFRNDKAARLVKRLPRFIVSRQLAEFFCTVAGVFRVVGLNRVFYEFGTAMFERAASSPQIKP